MTRRETRRWEAAVAAAVVAVAVGMWTMQPAAMLGAVVAVVYAGYGWLTALPDPAVTVERTLSTDRPAPGDAVSVTLSVGNEGDRTLPDVRVVDGVPDGLAVSGGTPGVATALRPGETVELTYDVTARRGEHAFGRATVLLRDLAGSVERETTAGASQTLVCRTLIEELPLATETIQYAGRVPSDDGGSGVEFHSTRDYRPGDPLARVDWRRLAHSGELTTVQFREQRAATVVLAVDARDAARVARSPGEPDGVELAAYAAERAFSVLAGEGHRTGLVLLDDDSRWVRPGTGEARRTEIKRALAVDGPGTGQPSDAGFVPAPGVNLAPDGDRDVLDALREQLPPAAQVLLFSPVTDGFAVDASRTLEAYGHRVTLLSPDVTAPTSAPERLACLKRRHRLDSLVERGIPAVDWDPDESLAVALSRAIEGAGR